MKLSEATLAWEHWRARRRFQRRLKAYGSSVLLAVIVLGLGLWGGFARLLDVGEKGAALSVKLGNPEGEDLPLKVSALPDPSMQAVMNAQRATALTTVEETRPATPDTTAGPAPAPKAKPAPANPASPAPSKPATAAAQTPPVPPAVPAPAPPVVTEKVIRGVEKGNSSELILQPQGQKISQNAYWPVYLFMPLPAKLDAALLGRVPASNLYSAEERRAQLLQFYSRGGEGLTLAGDPGLPVRPALWSILEDAGYDVANADYKRNNSLKPVVITFSIGVPKSPTDNPEMLEVTLDQSSGVGAVDEAVLYAFKKSTFANGTGQVAQGRYTYDFTTKK
jgi:hypothetical protein